MKILPNINSPEDLRKLNSEKLELLAAEIREFIIENVHLTGGHLASSLGVVELTLALHKVYESPKDKIVWDVGHQGYAHKILTGRRDIFHTNRQYGGISGFIKPSESIHDSFGVGHASTSISAGFGYVCAREVLKEEYNVVSIIGDGSITGGMAYEGLNNAGASGKNFLVILNDNEMSISQNVGAMSKYFTSILTDPTFNKLKNEIWNYTGKYKIGKLFRRTVSKFDKSVKAFLTPGQLFESMGFNYIGPVNGHNIPVLIKVLEQIKNEISGPVFLHIVTEKGKGFKPAEGDTSGKFHGVSPGILTENASKIKSEQIPKPTNLKYQDVFGKALTRIAEEEKNVIAITAAMKNGTGLSTFAEAFPGRFFDVGIAEEHAVTFAAAMSFKGIKPVVAIYSTFLQRSLDQIIHDVALQNLDMVLAIDRAGLVGEDGPTHHGVFDISFLRIVPGITLMAPKDEEELKNMLYTAIVSKGLFAIRYPRGAGNKLTVDFSNYRLIKPNSFTLEYQSETDNKTKVCILTVGTMAENACSAAKILEEQQISSTVYNMRFIKPLNEKLLLKISEEYDKIVTIEENSIIGGFGSSVKEFLSVKKDIQILSLGIPDKFIEHGEISKLLEICELDAESIARKIQQFL